MHKAIMIASLFIAAMLMNGNAAAEPTVEVVTRADVRFQPLNPARGDASPRAGVLWGDIGRDVPSGALIVFAENFSSPPHIHNITYRAVVISGAVHNDDPEAGKLWMGPGSFWTQPAGESHITAAAPESTGTAFLEILEGPYLVQPSEEAFDNGERPVNIESGNMVWLDAADLSWTSKYGAPTAATNLEVAFLWGGFRDGQKNGTMLKLPAGSTIELQGNGAWLRAVVIRGPVDHQLAPESSQTSLVSGSYFGSNQGAKHTVSCRAETECLVYVSSRGKYSFYQL